MVAVGVEIPLFPCKVTFYDIPHASHKNSVRIMAKVRHQLVHVVEVHVVVVHLSVVIGVAANIPVGVHLCAPFFLCPCHVHCSVLCGVGVDGRNIRHLALGVSVEVAFCPVVPSQHVSNVCCPPPSQRHAPAYASVQPCLAIPQPVGCCHEIRGEGVDELIGGMESQCGGQSQCSLHLTVEILLA